MRAVRTITSTTTDFMVSHPFVDGERLVDARSWMVPDPIASFRIDHLNLAMQAVVLVHQYLPWANRPPERDQPIYRHRYAMNRETLESRGLVADRLRAVQPLQAG